MSDPNPELNKWFGELQKLPAEVHLLCPRVRDDDLENYKLLNDDKSNITVEEKKSRISDGMQRIEITYWNTLIFGYDKREAGKWLEDFTTRLEHCLKNCPDCVFNWHMKRKIHLQKFNEHVGTDRLRDQG
jgi:senataxin